MKYRTKVWYFAHSIYCSLFCNNKKLVQACFPWSQDSCSNPYHGTGIDPATTINALILSDIHGFIRAGMNGIMGIHAGRGIHISMLTEPSSFPYRKQAYNHKYRYICPINESMDLLARVLFKICFTVFNFWANIFRVTERRDKLLSYGYCSKFPFEWKYILAKKYE